MVCWSGQCSQWTEKKKADKFLKQKSHWAIRTVSQDCGTARILAMDASDDKMLAGAWL